MPPTSAPPAGLNPGADTDGDPPVDIPEGPPPPTSLQEIFDPVMYAMLQAIAGDAGFAIRPYPEFPAPPGVGIGWYTYLGGRTIFYNPYHVAERGPGYAFAIFAHEIGHHHPDLMRFQEACNGVAGNYAHLFADALPISKILRNLNNVSADIFLEERNGHGIYKNMMGRMYKNALAEDFLSEEDYRAHMAAHVEEGGFTPENFPWDKAVDLEQQPFLFQQFSNGLLLVAKFGLPPEGTFDQRVHKALEAAEPHVKVLKNCEKTHVTTAHKVHAQIQIYTIASELTNADYIENPTALEAYEQAIDQMNVKLEPISDGDPRDAEAGENDIVAQTHGLLGEAIKGALGNIFQGVLSINAEQSDIPPDQLRSYINYVAEFSAYIEQLTRVLIDLLLKDYTLQEVKGRREGFMVQPGMETLTWLQYLAGDSEPPTQLAHHLERKPLTLQAALALDVSGSMQEFEKGMLGLLATLIEGIRRIHETILRNPQKYNFQPGRDRIPAQLELSTFADKPECVLPMGNLLGVSEAVKVFNQMQKRGGGTVTHEVLEFEYDRLTAGIMHDQVVRVLTLVTDGGDAGAPLDRIIEKIINDPRIYFLVIGVGSKEVREAIIAQYRKHLTPQSRYRMFAQGYPSVAAAILDVINFLQERLLMERHMRDLQAQQRGASVRRVVPFSGY